jgi:hypothetical protein
MTRISPGRHHRQLSDEYNSVAVPCPIFGHFVRHAAKTPIGQERENRYPLRNSGFRK